MRVGFFCLVCKERSRSALLVGRDIFFDKGIDKPRNIGYNMIDGEATMTVASSVANLKR